MTGPVLTPEEVAYLGGPCVVSESLCSSQRCQNLFLMVTLGNGRSRRTWTSTCVFVATTSIEMLYVSLCGCSRQDDKNAMQV